MPPLDCVIFIADFRLKPAPISRNDFQGTADYFINTIFCVLIELPAFNRAIYTPEL